MSFVGDFTKKVVSLRNTAGAFVAQRWLSDKDSLKYDYYTPKNWHVQQPLIPPRETPPSSGLGWTQSPYISMWTKMWGVNPISDLSKYRLMYRTVPIIKKGIDKTVATAISKGFKFDLAEDIPRRDEILAYVQTWIAKQQDFKQCVQMMASDALVYGNAYVEVVYAEEDTLTEEKYDPEHLSEYDIPDPNEQYKLNDDFTPFLEDTRIHNPRGKYFEVEASGEPQWLKPLDPVWMRVRRDSYGNIFGYIQYLSTPPVAFTPAKIIHVRYNPKSWWTENAYGTSQLMSIIRHQEAIWALENDLIIISHACAKPPLIFSCGNEDNPWTEGDFSAFVTATNGRGPGGDVYHRGDVEAKPLPFPASSLAPLLAHLDYHNDLRIITLGVPPDLLGISGMGQGAATVSFDDWINTIQQLQQYLGDALEEQLIKVLVENKFGVGTPVPKIVWNQIYEKDSSSEVQKVIALKNSQIITTNEARRWMEEIGKKLFPLEGGDVLGVPSVLPPGQDDVGDMLAEKPEDPTAQEDEEYEVVNDSVESGTFESSAEFTDVEVLKPYLYDPEESETVTEEAWWEQSPEYQFPRPELVADKDEEPPKHEQIKKAKIGPADILPVPQMEESPLKHPDIGPRETIEDRTEWPDVKPWKAAEDDVKKEKFASFDDVDFFIVSGDKVHEQYDPEWKNTQTTTDHDYIGGHHWVFDYIPENEIWVSDLDSDKINKTAIHEFTERALMKEGMDYGAAHHKALEAEGNLSGAEEAMMEYISPSKVIEELESRLKPYHKTDVKHAWELGKNKILIFDEIKGELLVTDNKKRIKKRMLVRSGDDVLKFIRKYQKGRN